MLDAAIDPDRATDFEDSSSEEATRLRAETCVGQARNYEDALDRARDFAAEEMFLIGLHLLSGPARPGPGRAGLQRARLRAGRGDAEAGQADFAADHGRVRGGRVAVMAMGKLGSREMTAASDLDLILIYDFPEDAGESDGAKPLGPGLYYSRFTQRLLAALTAPTRRGTLYEVDMRLRPSGPQGAARDPVLRLRPLPARRGRDVGAHGADPRPRDRGRRRASPPMSAKAIRDTLMRERDPAKVAREVARCAR